MTDTALPEKKFLNELRVTELRAELEKRGLDKNGIKIILTERLEKAIRAEGKDPADYEFIVSNTGASSLNTTPVVAASPKKLQKKAETPTDSEDAAAPPASMPLPADDPLVTRSSASPDEGKRDKEEDTEDTLDSIVTPHTQNADEELPVTEKTAPTAAPAKEKNEEEETKRSLWVKGLPADTKAAELKALFSTICKVQRAKIFKNKKETFGEVMLGCVDFVPTAIEKLNNSKFKENTIIVETKKFKPSAQTSVVHTTTAQKPKGDPNNKTGEEKAPRKEEKREDKDKDKKTTTPSRRPIDMSRMLSEGSRMDRDKEREREKHRRVEPPPRRPFEYHTTTTHRRVIATRPHPVQRYEPYHRPELRAPPPLHMRTASIRTAIPISRRDDRPSYDSRQVEELRLQKEKDRIEKEKLRLQLEHERLEKERLAMELEKQKISLMQQSASLMSLPQSIITRSGHVATFHRPSAADRERDRDRERERGRDRERHERGDTRHAHSKHNPSHRSRSGHRHHTTAHSSSTRTPVLTSRESHRDTRDKPISSTRPTRGRSDATSFSHNSTTSTYVRGDSLPVAYGGGTSYGNYAAGASRTTGGATWNATSSSGYGVAPRTTDYSQWAGSSSLSAAPPTWPPRADAATWNASTSGFSSARTTTRYFPHDQKY